MEKSYYQHCIDEDVISQFEVLLRQGGYYLRDVDGKFEATTHLGWDTPWWHIRHRGDLDCNLWHRIMFDAMGQKFVPSNCMNCYKVVVRPRTLRELFALANLQQTQTVRACKCGIEIRPTVHGLYGGYFYNQSLDEGLDCYQEIAQLVANDPGLGPNVKVILKRACTEFEHKFPESSKWRITLEQKHWEAMINKWFVRDSKNREQPSHCIKHVHRKWIEWAYANGDPTYADFTQGKPLYEPYETYHHLAKELKKCRCGRRFKPKTKNHKYCKVCQ